MAQNFHHNISFYYYFLLRYPLGSFVHFFRFQFQFFSSSLERRPESCSDNIECRLDKYMLDGCALLHRGSVKDRSGDMKIMRIREIVQQ